MDAPERLVLLELHGKGWVTVRRDDGEQERIRTTDLAGSFDEVQRRHQERKAEHQRLAELRLIWEQFSAGEPCPGCGRPYQGSRIDVPGPAVQLLEAGQASRTLDAALSIESESARARMVEQLLTAACVEQTPRGLVITERGRSVLADHHADEAFLSEHRDCHAHRHRVSGGPVHCGRCCPPPPLSPVQVAQPAVLLGPALAEQRTPRKVATAAPAQRPRLRLTDEQRQLLQTAADRRGASVKEALTALLSEAAEDDDPSHQAGR
jgi:hypothetical protein